MLTLYTTEIGKYYTLDGITKDLNVIRTPYEIEVKAKPDHPLNDLLYDYLLSRPTGDAESVFSKEHRMELLEADFDLNLDHYAVVRCPYLPFVHFIHLEEKWII